MDLIIPSLENYPPETQSVFHRIITDIVNETYVIPADFDYLNARFLSLNFLYRPFFWPALQALEKYLKANLLYHGVSVKGREFGHDIVTMAATLEKYDNVLRDLKLVPHEMHNELQKLNLWGSTDVSDFLSAIYQYGVPSNRYNYYGSKYEASYLLKLDQVTYVLRSNIVEIEFLEKIKNRDSVYYYAFEQNMYFAPNDYKHQSIYGKFGMNISVPSIEAALKGRYGNSRYFENWLKKNIPIKEDEIAKIKNR